MAKKPPPTGTVFHGPVMVLAEHDVLLNGDVMLVESGGYWGGFLTMRSVAGAELVQEGQPSFRTLLTIDGETPARIRTRRTAPDSPVLRVTGLGECPFPP